MHPNGVLKRMYTHAYTKAVVSTHRQPSCMISFDAKNAFYSVSHIGFFHECMQDGIPGIYDQEINHVRFRVRPEHDRRTLFDPGWTALPLRTEVRWRTPNPFPQLIHQHWPKSVGGTAGVFQGWCAVQRQRNRPTLNNLVNLTRIIKCLVNIVR